MDVRWSVALVAVFVAVSLVGAPATMADWQEQASLSIDETDRSDLPDETPVIEYETLSSGAQRAVRSAIESPDGDHTVYGAEDHPDEFVYYDVVSDTQGSYVVVYEGEHYHLTTMASGGFPIVFWILELPFVVYGLLLGRLAWQTVRDERSASTLGMATVPGVAFHLLGPELDFPLLAPMQWVALGVLATTVVAIELGLDVVRSRGDSNSEEER